MLEVQLIKVIHSNKKKGWMRKGRHTSGKFLAKIKVYRE